MTFLLSEDLALRTRLQGMVVNDQKADGTSAGTRPVGVFYAMPDQELRTQTYPYATIEMIDVQKDSEREMRGTTDAAYLIPKDATLMDDNGNPMEFLADLPIPVNIDYQITTFSRHPLHDREIVSQLLHKKLPFRFGYLELNDGTVRRLDVMDVSKRDTVEQGKRLFMNVVTVRISSEVASVDYVTLHKVLEVKVNDPADLEAYPLPEGMEPVASFTLSDNS